VSKIRLVDLPLIVKIGFAPAFALVMLAVLAVGSIIIERGLAADLSHVTRHEMPKNLRLLRSAERIAAAHGDVYRLLTRQAATIDTATIDADGQALLKEIDAISAEVKDIKTLADPDQMPAYDKLLEDLKQTRDALDVTVAMISTDFGTAAGFAGQFEDQYAKMLLTLDGLVKAQEAAAYADAAAGEARSKQIELTMILGSIATLLIAGTIAVFLTLMLRRDVSRIASATEGLARGNNGIDLKALTRADELGAIVSSLVIFRDNQLRLEDLRREQEAAEAASAEDRRNAAETATAIAEEQANVVSNLARALDALANGDLTYRLETEFPGDYRKLRDDFNVAVAKLEEAMRAIASATSSIQAGAGEISNSADDLSRRTEHQAASLEETAAALDEITATVNKTSEGANHGREATNSARNDAERSGEVVRKAVIAMNLIETSAKKINEIIGVVDEIAFQTNLLALNAGVEAARAGESGKGFAVVASEVRALAQRSAEAAKEIKSLISASTAQVAEGVELVGETGKSLDRIVRQVAEISTVVSEIAASAKEEALGLGQVNTAVNQMDQVTQQNAAMVEQSTAASRVLANEAQELARLVGRFKMSGGIIAPTQSRPTPSVAARAPVAPPQATAPAPRMSPPRASAPPAPLMRPNLGATARAIASQPAEDGWEEF
jgi:methyl-accepting chemotaxis protein